MARRLGTVFVWCAALLVTTLSAQGRQIGGVGIAIYEDVNFKGRSRRCARRFPTLPVRDVSTGAFQKANRIQGLRLRQSHRVRAAGGSSPR